MNISDIEKKQKGLENLIVLILGSGKKPLSHLHLQKETFLLWNFHPSIKVYLNFIKHYKGPFSKDIAETIQAPFYLEEHWSYTSQKKADSLSGGFITLTEKGYKEYLRLISKMKENEETQHLLSGIKMVREIYDNIEMEALLLLIYENYPDFIDKSSVSNQIYLKKERLARKLHYDGLIDDDKLVDLIGEKDDVQ